MSSGRRVDPGRYGRWEWRAREHATGLIHGLSSSRSDAVTWCKRHIVVRWDNWTEMPSSAVVNCIYCVLRTPKSE
jgi:hypothetical protein